MCKSTFLIAFGVPNRVLDHLAGLDLLHKIHAIPLAGLSEPHAMGCLCPMGDQSCRLNAMGYLTHKKKKKAFGVFLDAKQKYNVKR